MEFKLSNIVVQIVAWIISFQYDTWISWVSTASYFKHELWKFFIDVAIGISVFDKLQYNFIEFIAWISKRTIWLTDWICRCERRQFDAALKIWALVEGLVAVLDSAIHITGKCCWSVDGDLSARISVDDLKDLFIVTRLISWSVFFPVDTFRLENVACVEEREYVVLLWKVSDSAF